MPEYLSQVIFCCDRVGRAFLREITLYSNAAIVTNVEKLPPHYHVPIERMRDPFEEIVQTGLPFDEGNYRCPYCGRRNIFYCLKCGAISCFMTGAKSHKCPRCPWAGRTQSTDQHWMSPSGLLDGDIMERGLESPQRQVRREEPPPRIVRSPVIVEEARRIRRELMEKKMGGPGPRALPPAERQFPPERDEEARPTIINERLREHLRQMQIEGQTPRALPPPERKLLPPPADDPDDDYPDWVRRILGRKS